MDIAVLVVLLINTIVTLISPILLAASFLIKNIRKSKCCGGECDIRDTPIADNILEKK
jgi:Na+/glutamate symporter